MRGGPRHFTYAVRLGVDLAHREPNRDRLMGIYHSCRAVNKREVQGPPLSSKLALNRAAEIYLSRRKRHLRPRSLEAYKYCCKTLTNFFDPNRILSSFHEGDLRDYQRWRSLPDTNHGKAGASLINHELGALAQILKLAGLWTPISNYYERLPEINWAHPKVLTAEEEDRFFRFAASKPRWRTAYNSARLTANSTISGCELRTLRLENLRLNQVPPTVKVSEAAKNKHRMRAVPLNETALAAIRDLLVLARARIHRAEPSSHCFPQEEWSVCAGTAGQSLLHPNSISCYWRSLRFALGNTNNLSPPSHYQAAGKRCSGRDCSCHRGPRFAKSHELLQSYQGGS